VEARYSREQFIQLFQRQRDSDDIKDGLTSLYVGSWEPSISNGISGGTWGRRDDHSSQGPGGVDLCWDKDGSVFPLSLSEMTEEEKEVGSPHREFYCSMSDTASCLELHHLSKLAAQTTYADE
jgi:PERQ amino acid-rich with GYF domain-containing protein